MKATRKTNPKTVGDLCGGDIARVELLVRLTHRAIDDERWAIPLRGDMSESRDHVWLGLGTRVVEVLPVHRATVQGGEVDPLRGAE